MTNESSTELAQQRYLALQRTARKMRRPTDELMSLYVLEGFLARLGTSRYASKLVLKGGMLLAAFSQRRPTRDIDLQGLELANDADTVRSMIVDIASLSRPDGVEFDLSTATAEVIREGDEYSGIRVSMDAGLHTAQLRLKVDVNVGDPVWPEPITIDIPSILEDAESIRVIGYPLPMVLAEKLVTALARGVASTRWRDFADIVLLTSSSQVNGKELQGALDAVARHRQVQPLPLRDVLHDFPALAQDRWQRWLQRQELGDRLSTGFSEVLEDVFTFADPALGNRVADSIWIPDRGWTAR